MRPKPLIPIRRVMVGDGSIRRAAGCLVVAMTGRAGEHRSGCDFAPEFSRPSRLAKRASTGDSGSWENLPSPSVSVGIRLDRASSLGWQGICREINMIMRVRSWMKHPVVGVKPRDSAAHARVLMAQHRVNQLPVFEGPRLVGIVTDRDLRDAFPSLAETVIQSRRRLPEGADPSAIPRVLGLPVRLPPTAAGA